MTSPGKAPVLTGDWRCTKCGSVEEGLETERPPHCPDCGAPASALVFRSALDDEWDEIDDEEDPDEFGDDLDDDDGLYDDFDDEDGVDDDEED